ncbi:MAG: ABC transporter permease subunit [Chloroflexia bacterium]
MNWGRVRTVIEKEWSDTFRNKTVFFSLIFMPLFFAVLPLIMLYVMGQSSPTEVSGEDLGPFLSYQTYFGLENPLHVILVGMAGVYTIIFLMAPLVLPMMIASDSIVSEKVQKSLEPLLATPIRVSELLLGKALAAIVPAVLATWLAYGLYGALAALFLPGPVVGVIFSSDWLVGIGLLAPLMGLFSVNIGILISSRVNDTRAAQQIGGFIALPAMLVLIPMLLGKLALTATVFLAGAALFLVLDAGVLWLATVIFRRETILTRWK